MTIEMRNGQTPTDMLMRHGIPLMFGTETYRVRPRTMNRDKEWLSVVFQRVFGKASLLDDPNPIPAIIAALGDSTDDMLDMIVAYEDNDEGLSRQLPPREWFESNAYTQQITTAFTTLLEVAHPPFAVSRRLLPADKAAAIIGNLIEWVMRDFLKVMASTPPEPSPSASVPSGSERPKRSRKPGPTVSLKS
jgi:hypothetical protein